MVVAQTCKKKWALARSDTLQQSSNGGGGTPSLRRCTWNGTTLYRYQRSPSSMTNTDISDLYLRIVHHNCCRPLYILCASGMTPTRNCSSISMASSLWPTPRKWMLASRPR